MQFWHLTNSISNGYWIKLNIILKCSFVFGRNDKYEALEYNTLLTAKTTLTI